MRAQAFGLLGGTVLLCGATLAFCLGKGMKKTQLTLGIISESGQHSSTATTQAITALSKSWGGAMLWDVAEDSAGVYKDIQSAR